MGQFKGTKGKWNISFNPLSSLSEKGQWNIKAGEVGKPIAILPIPYGGINTEEEMKANALLISKAPEMLEEIKFLVKALKTISSFGATTPIIGAAEKLIQEATEL